MHNKKWYAVINRKERRKLRKDKDLIKELYSIISKYIPKLLDMFESLTDTRNQSYVTYKMKTICVTRLFGLLCGLTTMTNISPDDFNSDNCIKNLSNILFLNKYEDDKYIIFAADSINSIVDESSQQSNCVRTYCGMVSNNSCQVYFMRYKNDITKSFITIEVRNNKVVQAKTRFNEEPPIEAMNIIRKWEQTLIPIINE